MAQENLPSKGLFVDNAILNIYQTNIDQLISDLGYPVKIFLEPTTSGCPNCFRAPNGKSNNRYDSSNPFTINAELHKPFPNGSRCPVCIGTHKIFTERSITYTASISRAPQDLDYTQLGQNIEPQNVFRTKMLAVAFNDCLHAKKALINGEMCVPIRKPIRTGLQELRYCRMWWQRIEK